MAKISLKCPPKPCESFLRRAEAAVFAKFRSTFNGLRKGYHSNYYV